LAQDTLILCVLDIVRLGTTSQFLRAMLHASTEALATAGLPGLRGSQTNPDGDDFANASVPQPTLSKSDFVFYAGLLDSCSSDDETFKQLDETLSVVSSTRDADSEDCEIDMRTAARCGTWIPWRSCRQICADAKWQAGRWLCFHRDFLYVFEADMATLVTIWHIGGISERQQAIITWRYCRALAFDPEKLYDRQALQCLLPSLQLWEGKDMSTWPSRMPVLHLYARAGSAPCVLYLLSIGADPRVSDKNAMTPLHHCLFQLGQASKGKAWCEIKLGLPWRECLRQGYIECAFALLRAGTDLHVRSKFGETCYDLLQCLPMRGDLLAAASGVSEARSGSGSSSMDNPEDAIGTSSNTGRRVCGTVCAHRPSMWQAKIHS